MNVESFNNLVGRLSGLKTTSTEANAGVGRSVTSKADAITPSAPIESMAVAAGMDSKNDVLPRVGSTEPEETLGFLDLPAEIREQIYGYLFDDQIVFVNLLQLSDLHRLVKQGPQSPRRIGDPEYFVTPGPVHLTDDQVCEKHWFQPDCWNPSMVHNILLTSRTCYSEASPLYFKQVQLVSTGLNNRMARFLELRGHNWTSFEKVEMRSRWAYRDGSTDDPSTIDIPLASGFRRIDIRDDVPYHTEIEWDSSQWADIEPELRSTLEYYLPEMFDRYGSRLAQTGRAALALHHTPEYIRTGACKLTALIRFKQELPPQFRDRFGFSKFQTIGEGEIDFINETLTCRLGGTEYRLDFAWTSWEMFQPEDYLEDDWKREDCWIPVESDCGDA